MSISIAIGPDAAVEAGARWRVLCENGYEGPWLNSGESANDLGPHRYRVEFSPILGWRVPGVLKVRNVGDHVNCRTVVYKPVSAYELGRIPPQTAWHDHSLEFHILDTASRAADIRCDPTPDGTIAWDRLTGLFRYEPVASDKFPFSVTLYANDGEPTETFEITPMPILSHEAYVFAGAFMPSSVASPPTMLVDETVIPPSDMARELGQELEPAPVPFSMEQVGLRATYLGERSAAATAEKGLEASVAAAHGDRLPTIETMENEIEWFNNQERATCTIRIVGEDVVFEEGAEVYDAIHENPALKRLEVYAETVTVRSPLHLPQTTVAIWARELRFKDQGDAPSTLSTMPMAFTTSAQGARRAEDGTVTPAQDGLLGAAAGDISLHIESYDAPDPSAQRFILTGGRGQDPGPGLHGRDGSKMEGRQQFYQANMGSKSYRIVFGVHYSKSSGFDKTKHHHFGQRVWPTSGENATPAGRPGRGGDGGHLLASIDLATWAELSGGTPGKQGDSYRGGKAGEPLISRMVESWNKHEEPWGPHRWGWRYLSHEGKQVGVALPGGAVRSPVGQPGQPGSAASAGHSLSWLQPLLLNHIVSQARNDYLRGDLAAAHEKLDAYAELLDIYRHLDAWGELEAPDQLELGRVRNEIASMRSRIDGHLDYFGNPAGWVPMLSFEVNLTLFDNEIDRAIDLLYMTYWLREKAEGDQQSIKALAQLDDKLKQEIEDLKARYAEASEAVPELEAEASRITIEIDLIRGKLANLEEELRHKAEEQLEDPWWQTGLKLAGTLCSVLPVGQPALGAVGGVMNLAADFSPDDPWKTVTGATDIASAFAGARVTDKRADFESASKTVDTNSSEFDALASAQMLEGATAALSQGLEGVAQVMTGRQAPKSEVDALLLKLEAESAEFQAMSRELSALLDRKVVFAQRLADVLQRVCEIPNAITTDLLAIDSIGRSIAKGRQVLHDGRLAMHLDGIARGARERLLKYHYYLVKSYEYRLLEPYPGPSDLEGVFDELERLAELNMQGDEPHVLTREQFESLKGIYREVLASIAERIFDAYSVNPPELSAPRRFSLTQDEIDRLNTGQSVELNPMELGLFRLNEENVRIVDLELELPEVTLVGEGERRLAEVDLRFEHAGISQLREGGRTLRFCHPIRDEASSIAWGARYDAIDKRIAAIKPSAASDSLLRSLLKSDAVGNLMLYSRPGAWGDIIIHTEAITDPGTTIRIESMRLKLTYDFMRKSAAVYTIHVKAAPESMHLNPYFAVSQEDLNGRGDGRGDFYRAYRGWPQIEIEAQRRYGRWEFERWTDPGNRTIGRDPRLTIRAGDDQVARAVYTLTK